MDKVRALIEAGAPIPKAIRIALESETGMSASELARASDLRRAELSAVINGGIRPTARHLEVLIKHLGGTEAEWREVLWLAGKPAVVEGLTAYA